MSSKILPSTTPSSKLTPPFDRLETPSTKLESDMNENVFLYHDYLYFDGNECFYPDYNFEKMFYICIFEVLVIFTCLVNILVISILLRKGMRSVTNVILSAIAISDSLSGLVTLPAYITVYTSFYFSPDSFLNSSILVLTVDECGMVTKESEVEYVTQELEVGYVTQEPEGYTPFYQYDAMITKFISGFILTETSWNFFVVSKVFLSETFHTASSFLTMFLGGQKYASIVYPSKLKLTIEQTIICCIAICVVSPILYIQHLIKENNGNEMCILGLHGINCQLDITYSWVYISVRYFLPCAVLLLFSVLLIIQFRSGQKTRGEGNNSELSLRQVERRRESGTVIAILIVFLVPEVPYGLFLMFYVANSSMTNAWNVTLKTKKLVHLCYEILLVFSCHMNIYIYAFLDRRFRKTLCQSFIKPFQSFFSLKRRTLGTSTSSAKEANKSKDF